jgi:hypothetical protein
MVRGRPLSWLALLALPACNTSPLVTGNASDLLSSSTDMATSDDAQPSHDDLAAADLGGSPFDLGGFCGDPNSARAELNGVLAASPAVSATLVALNCCDAATMEFISMQLPTPIVLMCSMVALNCCDAATMEFISMQLPTPIVLMWRHQVGQGPNPPLTIDLANPPSGWSVSVFSGCDPTQPNCQPSDSYSLGLTGSLTVSFTGASFQMSTCLSAAEDNAHPHPVIHSLLLWSPLVTAH